MTTQIETRLGSLLFPAVSLHSFGGPAGIPFSDLTEVNFQMLMIPNHLGILESQTRTGQELDVSQFRAF